MSSQNIIKINQLLQNWKTGTVGETTWLKENGIYRQLLTKYVYSNWIKPIGKRAYIRSGDNVDWAGGLYSIQKQLKLPVHVGGKYALNLHGMSHYLSLGKKEDIEIYGSQNVRLPEWFKKYDWHVKINYFTTNLFNNLRIGLIEKDMGNFSITISSPERAIMELLYHVPDTETFDEASEIIETMFNLRSDLVLNLLENCSSIKVKRLFLYLAEKNNLPFFDNLDLTKVDLGSGKRSIIKNGTFNKKYNITIPLEESIYEEI